MQHKIKIIKKKNEKASDNEEKNDAETYKFFAVFFAIMAGFCLINMLITKQWNGLLLLDIFLTVLFIWLWDYETIPKASVEEKKAQDKANSLKAQRFNSQDQKLKIIRLLGDILLNPMICLILAIFFVSESNSNYLIKMINKITENKEFSAMILEVSLKSIAVLLVIISLFIFIYNVYKVLSENQRDRNLIKNCNIQSVTQPTADSQISGKEENNDNNCKENRRT